jgi:UDP-N-acetylmuramyl pentapeptide phosphotransferase/UDP-N-acetylglucosamine-1-phosphate transferase
MNTKIIGILLVVLSVIFFTYKGVTYQTHKKVLDLGPIEVTKEENHTFPFTPILGGVVLVAGIALIVVSGRKSL